MADGSPLPWPTTGGKALPRNRSSPGSTRESLQHGKRPKPSPWSRAKLGSGRNSEIRADESGLLNFYFDESGNFSLPIGDIHKVATCAGLVVPESSLPSLEEQFAA